MKPEEVQKLVDEIRDLAWDYEKAHGLEDILYTRLLVSIRHGTCRNPQECARIALTTQEIDFPRHTA